MGHSQGYLLGATLLGATLALSACLPANPSADVNAPANAPAGTCWAKWVEPAVLESRTYMREVQNGHFETVTEYEEISKRQEHVFQTPCPKLFTAYYIQSLQRALKVRGYFNGRVSGIYDTPTKAAVKAYQTTKGLPSDKLSLDTAVEFGLVPVEIKP